jgi:hypothetical protein
MDLRVHRSCGGPVTNPLKALQLGRFRPPIETAREDVDFRVRSTNIVLKALRLLLRSASPELVGPFPLGLAAVRLIG